MIHENFSGDSIYAYWDALGKPGKHYMSGWFHPNLYQWAASLGYVRVPGHHDVDELTAVEAARACLERKGRAAFFVWLQEQHGEPKNTKHSLEVP